MRKFGYWLAAAVMVLGLTVQDVRAEEGALKQLAPGTVFNYNAKQGPLKVTVNSMNGAVVSQTEAGASTANIDHVGFGVTLNPVRQERMSDADRARVGTLFPLKVGNTLKVEHRGVTRSNDWTCADKYEVTGQAKVTVPAGTYDTYVIETSQRDLGSYPWKGESTCWYSPEVGHCVKLKWRSTNGSDDWELVSVTPAAAQ